MRQEVLRNIIEGIGLGAKDIIILQNIQIIGIRATCAACFSHLDMTTVAWDELLSGCTLLIEKNPLISTLYSGEYDKIKY